MLHALYRGLTPCALCSTPLLNSRLFLPYPQKMVVFRIEPCVVDLIIYKIHFFLVEFTLYCFDIG